MNLIFLGSQGSGKGTQAKIVSNVLNILHISTGDFFRNLKGRLKHEADYYMSRGELVPDGIVINILEKRFHEKDCINGFILDGFPRNISQAEKLEKITNIDMVFEIYISKEDSVKRLSGRRNCAKCGKVYNILTSPKPLRDNLCDVCHIPLTARADDSSEAILKRLDIYYKETLPLVKRYSAVRIDGMKEIDDITKNILGCIGAYIK